MSLNRIRLGALCPVLVALIALACTLICPAQQTLGSLNGTVVDSSGSAVFGASVNATNEQTGLTRSTKTLQSGYWQILELPVGSYQVTIIQPNYETEKLPGLQVQGGRAATVNATLKAGSVAQSVTVTASPMMNATDTTNGYTLDKDQIAETPLATGSFTQLAILAPGVASQFIAGVGTNQGLGNQNIWANGQRSTSNTMTVNGVSVTNLFNGQTASEQSSQRYQDAIGEGGSTAGQYQDNISVYGSNGNGLASPPPEFLQEISIQTSMYDAQQGQTSGAHIGMITASGTNQLHGQVYGLRGTNFMNADPFFYKQDVLLGTIPQADENPQLHKWVAGGTVGGPIVKNKLFFFLGYQHLYTSDQYGALGQVQVPYGLTSDRSLTGISNACASYAAASLVGGHTVTCPATSSYNGAAVALLQAQLPNGQYLIPSADANGMTQVESGLDDASQVGTSIFRGDQATASLDYNVSNADHLSAKYFYQHMPTTSPYAVSNYTGFPVAADNGAQVASLTNTVNLGSHINWVQVLGFSRQKVYSHDSEALTASDVGIALPTGNDFPGFELEDFAAYSSESNTSDLGPYSSGDFFDDGYFENRISPSSDLIWSHGRHTITVGGNFSYDQLNIRNLASGFSRLVEKYFTSFLTGSVYSGSLLTGNSNRYYRSHDIGSYAMDKWQVLPNLSISAGIRYDFDGPLSEKNGMLVNFDPSLYSATDSAVTNSGLVIAGNNKQYGTPGVSDSTLKGRQWGIGPRLGVAWAPNFNHGTVVWRAGAGMYYDRGQYFQYLSPPYSASSEISGPFGATQEPPFAAFTTATGTMSQPFPTVSAPVTPATIASTMPTVNSIKSTCNAYNIYHHVTGTYDGYNCSDGQGLAGPLVVGNYNVNNKLPYTEDWILDMQWQPRSDMAFDIGYVGNRGRHQVIPLPFNEPVICTPGNYQSIAACNGQQYSYGLQVLSTVNTPNGYYGSGDTKSTPYAMANEPIDSFSGGNVDLRVPFVGYDPNSASFSAVGVSAYDALQAHLQKRMSHGIQAGVSYTWSHTLDEQSDEGLFFTGLPGNLHGSYANADFDQTNNLTFNFVANVPNPIKDRSNLFSYVTNNWSFLGIVVMESGQPYSVYDYHGTVGGQYFGSNANLINPILPLQPGISPSQAKTGKSGAFTSANPTTYNPALNPSDFEVPLLSPGQNGVPPCDTTTDGGNAGPGGGPLCDVYETTFVSGQRNIFRQSFQKRADITLQKVIPIKDRYNLNYQFEVFNVTNTPSFDVPTNSVDLDPSYDELNGETYGQQVQPEVSTTVKTPTGTQSCSGASAACAYELYTAPGTTSTTLGVVRNTIGSGRIIEMAMHLTF